MSVALRKSPENAIDPGRGASRRLAAHIRRSIDSGDLQPGDRLPGIRELTKRFQLGYSTVNRALVLLVQEGWAVSRQGEGTFVRHATKSRAAPSRTAAFALVALDVAMGYYRHLLAAFEQFANRSGRPAFICNSANNVDRQGNHLMGLLDQQVAGVVLNPPAETLTPPYHVRVLQNAGIPVVLLHRSVPNVSAPVLDLPGMEVGRRGGQLLIEAGHRRIAFLDSCRTAENEQCVMGLREVLSDLGVELPDELVHFSMHEGFDRADFYDRYKSHVDEVVPRMLSINSPPTALFLGWSEIAEHVYLLALRMGLRVPEDLSIICLGGAHCEGAILNRLTTVTIDETAVAEQAVQLLMEMQKGKRPIIDGEVIPLSLSFRAGETLGPPARR